MLVLGAIGDKYSRRGALVLGLLLFAAGSVMGSMVDETSLVIVARAIMGVGAAVVMPATLSLLVATFPRSERVKAITAWTATSGLAIAVGPLVAGWLLEDHAWGSTFLINVPIAVAAVVGALALVPPSKAEGMGRIDYVGGLLSIVSVGSLVYAAIEGPHFGWGAGPVTAAVVAGSSRTIYLHQEAVISNGDIAKATVLQNRVGSTYSLAVTFTAEGARKMEAATRSWSNKPLAVLLDGRVVTCPTVRGTISTSAMVDADFSKADADRIVAGIIGR